MKRVIFAVLVLLVVACTPESTVVDEFLAAYEAQPADLDRTLALCAEGAEDAALSDADRRAFERCATEGRIKSAYLRFTRDQ